MDLFFSIKNKYVINASAKEIYSELYNLVNRKWYDFSENIEGKIQDNGNFKLSPKWTLGYINVLGVPQDFTYLTGRIKSEKGKTIIETTARPNYAMVIVFYFVLLLIVLKTLSFNLFIEGTLLDYLLFLPPVLLIVAAIMIFGVLRLRNKFERVMQLQREE